MEEINKPKLTITMSKICRSCMNESSDLQSIFAKLEMVGLETQLSEMLTACASIQVSSGDGLPASMCAICVHQLSNAFTFKQQCQSTDSKLRDYVNSLDTEIKQEKDGETFNIVIKPDIDHLANSQECDDDFQNDTYEDGDDSWDLSDENETISDKIKKKSKISNQCHVCLKQLATSVGLKLHLRKHDKEKIVLAQIHMCDLCGKTFNSTGSLTEHKVEEHNLENDSINDVSKENESVNESINSPDFGSSISHTASGRRVKKSKPELEPAVYECRECKKVLSTLSGLQIHQRRHTGKDLAPCYVNGCTKTFTKLSHLKRHLHTHGIDNPSLEEIKSESSKTKRENYQCEFCDRKFVYKKSFAQHMKSEHAISEDEETLTADLHLKVEPSNEENGTQPPEDPENGSDDGGGEEFECHVCNQKFTKVNHLTRHMTLHRNVLSHQCEHCEKVFLTPEHLETHMNECHRQKPYACTKCDKIFNRGEHLIRHLKTNHDKETEIHKCSVCEKELNTSEQLGKHIKQHILKDKRHVCDVCNKAFNRLDNLRTHQRAHTGDVPVRLHLCIYCGKEFNNSSNMIVHMRRHTGERPYKCEVCGKGFPRSHDLKCHERTHSGERPYLCTLCGKSFNKSNKLVRHTRVHTGERPYVCSLCGRAFTQSNDLALHMRRHTGSRPYACGVCPARFIQSGQLKTHRRTQGHWVEQEVQFRGNRVEPVHIEGMIETKIKYRKPRNNNNSQSNNSTSQSNTLAVRNLTSLTQNQSNVGIAMIRDAATLIASQEEQNNPSTIVPNIPNFEDGNIPTTASFNNNFNFSQFG